jgi:hypothetical protein
VVEHPLDLADPDRHPSELGGIRVDLNPEDRLRADTRELLSDPEDERAPPDDLKLEVLEGLEGDVQEVAGAAGRIEDPDGPEAIEKRSEESERLGIRPWRLDAARREDRRRRFERGTHTRRLGCPERLSSSWQNGPPSKTLPGVFA